MGWTELSSGLSGTCLDSGPTGDSRPSSGLSDAQLFHNPVREELLNPGVVHKGPLLCHLEALNAVSCQGIAYVPFFPLGGFTPLQSSALDAVAALLQATPMQVALAWLLQRSPNILVIPGTSSLKHLRENLQASMLQIPSEVLANLDSINGHEKEF
jgi:predicted oxidoreductase